MVAVTDRMWQRLKEVRSFHFLSSEMLPPRSLNNHVRTPVPSWKDRWRVPEKTQEGEEPRKAWTACQENSFSTRRVSEAILDLQTKQVMVEYHLEVPSSYEGRNSPTKPCLNT